MLSDASLSVRTLQRANDAIDQKEIPIESVKYAISHHVALSYNPAFLAAVSSMC